MKNSHTIFIALLAGVSGCVGLVLFGGVVIWIVAARSENESARRDTGAITKAEDLDRLQKRLDAERTLEERRHKLAKDNEARAEEEAQKAKLRATMLPPSVSKTARSGGWKLLPKEFVGHGNGQPGTSCWAKEIVPVVKVATQICIADIVDNPRESKTQPVAQSGTGLSSQLRILSINGQPILKFQASSDMGARLKHGALRSLSNGMLEYVYDGGTSGLLEQSGLLEEVRLTVANGSEQELFNGADTNQILDMVMCIVPAPRPKIAQSVAKSFEFGTPCRFTAKELGLETGMNLVSVNGLDMEEAGVPIYGLGVFKLVNPGNNSSSDLLFTPSLENDGLTAKTVEFQVAAAGASRYVSNPAKVTVTIKERNSTEAIDAFLDSLEVPDFRFPQYRFLKLPDVTRPSDSRPITLGRLPPELSKGVSIGLEPGTFKPDQRDPIITEIHKEDQKQLLRIVKEEDAWKIVVTMRGDQELQAGEFRISQGKLSFQWTIQQASPWEVDRQLRRGGLGHFLKIGILGNARYVRLPPVILPSKEIDLNNFRSHGRDPKTGNLAFRSTSRMPIDELLSRERSWKELPFLSEAHLIVDPKVSYFAAHDNPLAFAKGRTLYLQVDTRNYQQVQLLDTKMEPVLEENLVGYQDKPHSITFAIEAGVAGKLKPPGGKEQEVLFAIIKDEK